MFPGMNPRAMKQAMKKMGIAQEDIEATEVIIRTPDREIVITEPAVAKIKMMGEETFQISGNITERELSNKPDISDDDIETVMKQANVGYDEAKGAIEANEGDLAEAIISLSK